MTNQPRVSLAVAFAAAAFFASLPSAQAQVLDLFLTSDTDVAAPSDRLTYTARVTNTGAGNLTDVAVRLFVPTFVFGLSGALKDFSPHTATIFSRGGRGRDGRAAGVRSARELP